MSFPNDSFWEQVKFLLQEEDVSFSNNFNLQFNRELKFESIEYN